MNVSSATHCSKRPVHALSVLRRSLRKCSTSCLTHTEVGRIGLTGIGEVAVWSKLSWRGNRALCMIVVCERGPATFLIRQVVVCCMSAAP